MTRWDRTDRTDRTDRLTLVGLELATSWQLKKTQESGKTGDSCNKKSKTNSGLRNHMEEKHSSVTACRCDDCGTEDKLNAHLKPHVNSHTHAT